MVFTYRLSPILNIKRKEYCNEPFKSLIYNIRLSMVCVISLTFWKSMKMLSYENSKGFGHFVILLLHSVKYVVCWTFAKICKYWLHRILPNYRTYPYKRTVKQFRSLQITVSVLFVYFFMKAYVMDSHLNCIDLSMQFKWVPITFDFIKKFRKEKHKNIT